MKAFFFEAIFINSRKKSMTFSPITKKVIQDSLKSHLPFCFWSKKRRGALIRGGALNIENTVIPSSLSRSPINALWFRTGLFSRILSSNFLTTLRASKQFSEHCEQTTEQTFRIIVFLSHSKMAGNLIFSLSMQMHILSEILNSERSRTERGLTLVADNAIDEALEHTYKRWFNQSSQKHINQLIEVKNYNSLQLIGLPGRIAWTAGSLKILTQY